MMPSPDERRRLRRIENLFIAFFALVGGLAVVGVLISLFRPVAPSSLRPTPTAAPRR